MRIQTPELPTDPRQHSPNRIAVPVRVGALAALGFGVVLLISACSGTPVPTSNSQSPNAGTSQQGSSSQQQGGGGSGSSSGSAPGTATVAYSQCMRSHGISNFPDPDNHGSLTITSSMGIDTHSAMFGAAQKACHHLMHQGTGAQSQQKIVTTALEYAKCMRSHGVPNFPDPDSKGGFSINSNNGVDPSSTAYTAADKACSPILNGTQP